MITSEEELLYELNNIKLPYRIEIKCPSCEIVFSKEFRKNSKITCLCKSCSFKQTRSLRSTEDNLKSEEKRKATLIKKWGSWENYTKHVTIAYKDTCQRKFGVDNIFQTESFIKNNNTPEKKQKRIDSIHKSIKAKYGVDYFCQHSECRDNITYNEDISQKIKATKLCRYGDENYNNPDKHADTCLQRYGVNSYSQTDEYASKRKKKYTFGEETFDSFPELALWVYAKDHDEDICRCTQSFSYYYRGVEHKYFPDFIYNNDYIEIKGDHFFEGQVMINPFDRSQDALYEAKHRCGLLNNVKFITYKDYKKYIDYYEEKYGRYK